MDFISSFFSNIKDKLTNPFFGTLILVLIIHHWKLWYSIFNFEDNITLEEKILFINNYIASNLTLESFAWDILLAFIYMLSGYAVIVLTRGIVIAIEHNIMPLLTRKLVSKNVVLKSLYDDVVKEREKYFDQYEEQRKHVRSFSETIDDQTNLIKKNNNEYLEQSKLLSVTNYDLKNTKEELKQVQNKADNISTEYKITVENLEKTKKELQISEFKSKKYSELFFNEKNHEFFNSFYKLPPEVINKAKELKELGKWNTFIAVGKFFDSGGNIAYVHIDEMKQLDLVFEIENSQRLTPLGEILYFFNKLLKEVS